MSPSCNPDNIDGGPHQYETDDNGIVNQGTGSVTFSTILEILRLSVPPKTPAFLSRYPRNINNKR